MSLRSSSVRSVAKEELEQELMHQTEESYRSRDRSGKFGKIIMDGLPEDFNQWKPKEARHVIDVLPFIGGEKHNKAPGRITYNLDVWVHKGVGIQENQYICLARTDNPKGAVLGKCPICEYQTKLKKAGETSDEELKKLNPSRQCLYNVWVHDDIGERDKGVQVWQVAHWFFEKHIMELARNPLGGGLIPFQHPDHGKSIAFTLKISGMSHEYLAHQFLDRKYTIPEELLEKVWALDQLVKWTTYAEIYEAFFNEEYVAGQAMPGVLLQADAASDPYGHAEPGKAEGFDHPVGPDMMTVATKDDIPFNSPPPDKQEQSVSGQAATTVGTTCPGGGSFGKEVDSLDACNTCQSWDNCYDAHMKMKRQDRQAKQESERAGRPVQSRRGRQ